MISLLWRALPIWTKAAVIAAIFALVIGSAWIVYARIEKKGYDRAVSEYNAAALKAAETARKDIVEVGNRYEKLRNGIRAQNGYNAPVSPLVGDSIDRMPSASP